MEAVKYSETQHQGQWVVSLTLRHFTPGISALGTHPVAGWVRGSFDLSVL